MKVVDLTNVRRKETLLYYRKEFQADAILQFLEETTSAPVEFVLEHKATGGVEVRVTLTGDLDYPIMPVVANLKRYILDLHQRGSLP